MTTGHHTARNRCNNATTSGRVKRRRRSPESEHAPRPKRTTRRSRPVRYLRRISIGVIGWLSIATLYAPQASAVDIPNPIDWVGDKIGDVVGGGVSSVASAIADVLFSKVFEFIADLIAAAVTKATELLVSVFDAVTVKIGDNGVLNGGLSASLQLQMLALGAALLVLFFLIRIISALITQQMGKVARELFFDLPFTVIGTAATGVIGVLILKLTDEMASALSGGFAENLGSFAGQFFTTTALVEGGVFQVLFAILYILGAIFVGLELIVRASLLTIIFVVAPVMMATRTWEGSRRYARRFIEISLALMFAKPAAAMALALGAAQMADGVDATSPVQMMLGTTIVLLAAFMPFALFKLIPLVEGAASVQQGIKGAPVRVAQTVAGFATTAALLSGAGAAGAAAGAAGPGGGGPGGTGSSSGGPSGGGPTSTGPTSSGLTGSGSGGGGGTGGGSGSGGSGPSGPSGGPNSSSGGPSGGSSGSNGTGPSPTSPSTSTGSSGSSGTSGNQAANAAQRVSSGSSGPQAGSATGSAPSPSPTWSQSSSSAAPSSSSSPSSSSASSLPSSASSSSPSSSRSGSRSGRPGSPSPAPATTPAFNASDYVDDPSDFGGGGWSTESDSWLPDASPLDVRSPDTQSPQVVPLSLAAPVAVPATTSARARVDSVVPPTPPPVTGPGTGTGTKPPVTTTPMTAPPSGDRRAAMRAGAHAIRSVPTVRPEELFGPRADDEEGTSR